MISIKQSDKTAPYTSIDRDGSGVGAFAPRLVSSAGATSCTGGDAEERSPLGPLVPNATEEGHPALGTVGKSVPYHGCFYRILTGQGEPAKGAAYDYPRRRQDGRRLCARGIPGPLRRFWIMTFIVNRDGLVYEKDLGDDTSRSRAA